MSLQSIINIADSLSIDRRKLVGVQYARNELPRVSETPTFNPWKLTLTTPNAFKYNEARQILETLDQLDRRTPSTVTFATNALSWIFAYTGDLSVAQRSSVTFVSFTNNQLVLNVGPLTGVPAGTVIINKGDFIQIVGYPYPFTSTTQVIRGTGSTVTVTTHRPNILSSTPTTGTQFNWGNSVIFNVFCPNMPTYKLIPGGYTRAGSQVVNNAIIEFSDNFKLYEYVSAA